MSSEHKKASAWFEVLYKEKLQNSSNLEDSNDIPWAKMEVNPYLDEYLKNHLANGKALVVGCGLGDDALALSEAGFDVTAIDISESAIKWCNQRFDGFGINFCVQDVFELPDEMLGQYDFVFESLTVQSLPLALRDKIITAISSLVAPNGKILIIAHGKQDGEKFDGPPWPLTMNELKLFGMKDLTELEFSIFEEQTPISKFKFRALYSKVSS